MKRIAIASLFLLAAALPRAARAEGGTMFVGSQFSVAPGADFMTSQSEVNAEIARAGHPELATVSPELQIRFGVTFYNGTLGIHFAGNMPGTEGEDEGLGHYRASIGADFGYRLRLGRVFTIHPLVGIGSLSSSLCLVGKPDATSWTSLPPFEQLLRNPGRRACLKASDVGLELGLAFAANLRLFHDPSKDEALAGYLSIGPRLSYRLPLGGSRTWESSSAELKVDLPEFEGPVAPLAGVYAVIEVEFRVGIESIR